MPEETEPRSPLEGYEPKSWNTYDITPEDAAQMPVAPVRGVVEIQSSSEMIRAAAQRADYDPSRYFFYDYEQVMAGHTPYGFSTLLWLQKEFMGHAPGKWAFVTYEGMDEDPRHYTLFIEN